MLKIAKYPEAILRKTAKPVIEFNDELIKLADNMAKVMYADDGIGLAGPQISQSLRIVVIGLGKGNYRTYINPEITFFCKEKGSNEEGCLSLPKIFGKVTRSKKIHIKYQDLAGQTIKEKVKGMEAIVLQHEVDHLDGILFIDRADKITQGQEILDEFKKQLDGRAK